MDVLLLLNRRLVGLRHRASSCTSCLSAAQCISLGFITCFGLSCFLSKLLLSLLVAVADHAVKEAVWSTHWVLVAIFLGLVNFFVDVGVGFLVGGGDIVIEFSWKGRSVFLPLRTEETIGDVGSETCRFEKAEAKGTC